MMIEEGEADIWHSFCPLVQRLDSDDNNIDDPDVLEAKQILQALRQEEEGGNKDDQLSPLLSGKEHLMLCSEAASQMLQSNTAKEELLQQILCATRKLSLQRRKVYLSFNDALSIPWRLFPAHQRHNLSSLTLWAKFLVDLNDQLRCADADNQDSETTMRLAIRRRVVLEVFTFFAELIAMPDQQCIVQVGSLLLPSLLNALAELDPVHLGIETILSIGEVPSAHDRASDCESDDEPELLELYRGDHDAEALDADDSLEAQMVTDSFQLLNRANRTGASCIAYLVLVARVERHRLSALFSPSRLFDIAALHFQRLLSRAPEPGGESADPASGLARSQRLAVELLSQALAPAPEAQTALSPWAPLPAGSLGAFARGLRPVLQAMATHPDSGARTQLHAVLSRVLQPLEPTDRLDLVLRHLYKDAPTPPAKGLMVDAAKKALAEAKSLDRTWIRELRKFSHQELMSCGDISQEMDMYTSHFALLELLFRKFASEVADSEELRNTIQSIRQGTQDYIVKVERRVKDIELEELHLEDIEHSWVNLRPGQQGPNGSPPSEPSAPNERMPLNPTGLDKKKERELEIANIFRAQIVENSSIRLLDVLKSVEE